MQLYCKGTESELCKVFGVENMRSLMHCPGDFELKIGTSTFSCWMSSILETSGKDGFVYSVDLMCYDKKAEDIRKAKALVNSTKEAHKEAQRKLSELMEEK